jgi:hypothetical protein
MNKGMRLAGGLLVVGLSLVKGGSEMTNKWRAAFAGPAGGLKILGYGGTGCHASEHSKSALADPARRPTPPPARAVHSALGNPAR